MANYYVLREVFLNYSGKFFGAEVKVEWEDHSCFIRLVFISRKLRRIECGLIYKVFECSEFFTKRDGFAYVFHEKVKCFKN